MAASFVRARPRDWPFRAYSDQRRVDLQTLALDDVLFPAHQFCKRYFLIATNTTARMEVVQQVKALANIGLRKHTRIALGDIERLFDEKAGRAIRVIRLLSIPSAMRHHNRMDPWHMVDAGLGIELLEVHVGIDKHFQRQVH